MVCEKKNVRQKHKVVSVKGTYISVQMTKVYKGVCISGCVCFNVCFWEAQRNTNIHLFFVFTTNVKVSLLMCFLTDQKFQ